MGWKRRWANWDRGKRDDSERWPSKSPRRWEQQNHAGFSAWREEEGLSKPEGNGWECNTWREEGSSKPESNGWEYNTRREEGSSKSKSNGWECNTWREEGSSKPESNGWGDCYSSVPSWERTFCSYVCRVPWRKICDAKRMRSTFKSIAEWDDSASREAFENEKTRYWAKINHLPCDIPLPSPYMYVDNVDFDTVLDHEIAADLERSAFNPDTVNNFVSNTSDTLAHETVVATGWGEAENSSTNWDKYIEKPASRLGDQITLCDPWGCKMNQSFDVNGGDGSWKHRVSWKDQEDPWKPQDNWKNSQEGRNSGWSCMNSRYQDDQMGNKSWKKVQPQITREQGEFLGSRNDQRMRYSSSQWQRDCRFVAFS